MAYVITKTTGEQLAVINDGAIDQTTSLTLVGRNYSNFGQIINEDFVRLLENFSDIKAPTNPIKGQLWYDSNNKKLKIFNGTDFNSFPQLISSDFQPTGQAGGDFFFNTNEKKLYVFDGANYNLIGPQFTGLSLLNGVIAAEITDTNGNSHYVLKHNLENITTGNVDTVAITATESFDTYIDGYPHIKRGITLYSSTIPTAKTILSGTSSAAQYADIAERYRADAVYEAGTVLSVGGEYEVTISRTYQDEKVAGIISAYPAYAMNEDLGPVEYCPYIALKGRVPCKVKGPVKKGDLLVTSEFPGHAESKKPGLPNVGIIGKALHDFNEDYGVVEVMVQ